MKRLLLLLFTSLALASCGAWRDKKAEELAYARFAARQSLDAYQICTEENVGDEIQCSALIKLIDEDNRRVGRLSTR